jgi:hypothetical protein
LTGFFLIKPSISSKYPILAIFSTGVDALPLEQKNRIVQLANGARIGVIGDHVPFEGDILVLTGSMADSCPQYRGSLPLSVVKVDQP